MVRPVLLLGTGLTMVDVVLTLGAAGHRGPLVALSRHGLSPRAHGVLHSPAIELELAPPTGLSALTRSIRRAARHAEAEGEETDWRSVVDAVRSGAQELWQRFSPDERQRFLRHLRPFWDAHCHRIPPAVANRIEALRASGQLRVEARRA